MAYLRICAVCKEPKFTTGPEHMFKDDDGEMWWLWAGRDGGKHKPRSNAICRDCLKRMILFGG